jgi:hypothetical protein
MWKWIGGLILLGAVGFVAWAAYDYYEAGLHTRPEMPPGAFSLSYKNGLRAILVDVPDDRETRRYFGRPVDVPFYLEDAWAFCSPPEGTEVAEAERWLAEAGQPGMRFEAICRIDVDGETVIRGFITTVPRL